MYWLVNSLDVVHCILDGESPDIVLFDDSSLKVVNVADPTVGDLVKSEQGKTHSASPVLLLQTSADGERASMSVAGLAGSICVDIRVGVDPDHFEVGELCK